MSELIQKQADEISIVIYDAPLPPKYFRLTKRFIKTLFVMIPLFLSLIFISLFTWGLGRRLQSAPAPELPSVLNDSDNKMASLESEITSLKQSNEELIEKLGSTPTQTSPDDPFLLVIKKPYGMQNLITENKVTLDQIQFSQDNNKVSLKFQIISSTPEKKVTGHILVFMLSSSGVMAYPSEVNTTLLQGVKYSTGEPFSVSRLRPTNAEFTHNLTGDSAKFLIYIFNREGDLLLLKETESFKVGNK